MSVVSWGGCKWSHKNDILDIETKSWKSPEILCDLAVSSFKEKFKMTQSWKGGPFPCSSESGKDHESWRQEKQSTLENESAIWSGTLEVIEEAHSAPVKYIFSDSKGVLILYSLWCYSWPKERILTKVKVEPRLLPALAPNLEEKLSHSCTRTHRRPILIDCLTILRHLAILKSSKDS